VGQSWLPRPLQEGFKRYRCTRRTDNKTSLHGEQRGINMTQFFRSKTSKNLGRASSSAIAFPRNHNAKPAETSGLAANRAQPLNAHQHSGTAHLHEQTGWLLSVVLPQIARDKQSPVYLLEAKDYPDIIRQFQDKVSAGRSREKRSPFLSCGCRGILRCQDYRSAPSGMEMAWQRSRAHCW
jgi:hypothetical protein